MHTTSIIIFILSNTMSVLARVIESTKSALSVAATQKL